MKKLEVIAKNIFKNDIYRVLVRPCPENKDMTWISIYRHDGGHIMDWRHMQEIKNQVMGPEHEAVQLFPAESRLVDEANAFHIWAQNEPGYKFRFGLMKRSIKTQGRRQRLISSEGC